MSHRKGMQWFAVVAMLLVMASLGPATAAHSGTVVTKGRFVTLSGGTDLGYSITGTAFMARNRAEGGVTRVKVTVAGLDPTTTYKVHVHNQPCSYTPPGGGHYQNVIGGAVDEFNEIWPTVSTDAAGDGVGRARHEAWARPDAQSIVIHWPVDSAVRLACADLN